MWKSLEKLLRSALGDGSVLVREPMSSWTTFRIGGPARLFCMCWTYAQLIEAVTLGWGEGVPVFVLGGGSNLLVKDAGLEALCVKNEVREAGVAGGVMTVSAGMPLDEAVRLSLVHGSDSMLFAAGIPGTVGGAVCGNAGAYGRTISELLVWADVLEYPGRIRRVGPDYFAFSYRYSSLKGFPTRAVILEVALAIGAAGSFRAGELYSAYEARITERRKRLPPAALGCAGCVFKNIPDGDGGRRYSAGVLLDACGAKNMREGGACVYERHANIIVNSGEACADDVIRLMVGMKELVRSSRGIELQEEIMIIPPDRG